MTYRVLKKYVHPKERQKEVNNFFMKVVKELTNDIIDEACKLCYEKYKLYPNVYAIKIMREVLNTKVKMDVSINDDDLINIDKDA